MRVAYLINQYPAVSHTFIRREIAALEDQGVEVLRFALRGWDGELVDPDDIAELDKTRHTLRDGGVSLVLGAAGFALRHPKRFLRGVGKALAMAKGGDRPWPFHLIYLAHAVRIWGWLKGQDVTHLHAHFGSNSAEIAALTHVIGGPKFSYTAHGSEVFDNPKGHALPIKAQLAEAVVTSCAYIGAQMMYHIPTEYWPKVHVVHCGLGPDSFAAEPVALPKTPAFLSVGRLSPEKGHLVLLEAFAKVAREHPQAKLVIVGDGPMRGAIKTRIADLRLEGMVNLAGWATADQVQNHIRNARVLVHPSFTEGLPVVIMEAMAQYRPVISTYIAGIPELVKEGQTGWLVPAGRVDELAHAMGDCAALSDAALKERARVGFERVSARHDVMKEAAKLRNIFAAEAGA